MDTQQARALIYELRSMNKNLDNITRALNRIDVDLKEINSGSSKDEQETLEEEKNKGGQISSSI